MTGWPVLGCVAILLMSSSALVTLYCLKSTRVTYKNPVRSAAEDEVKHLPGYVGKPINFKHYSGYLAADELEPTNKFLHYWLVESQSNPDRDPLVLWLNGGPCCSSLAGLLTEIGPFKLARDSERELAWGLRENEFSWNKRANVLFLESPVGTGFSYAVDHVTKTDDDVTAAQNHVALQKFMKKFPNFDKRPLYLTGQSYAGVYLPTLGVLLDKDPEFNLKGVAIGNGFMNWELLQESVVFYNYHHGLFGETTWANITRHCCSGVSPALGQCKFSDEHSDCERYASSKRYPKGLDVYNYLAVFDGSLVDQSGLNSYLRQPEVERALHIPSGLGDFERCRLAIEYKQIYPMESNGLAPQLRRLIESPRNLTLLSYNGDLDLACDFIGVERFIDGFGRPIVKDHGPWRTRGQVSGFVKYFDRITFLTVKGAGHYVPADKPAEAQNMFHMFLDGMKPPS